MIKMLSCRQQATAGKRLPFPFAVTPHPCGPWRLLAPFTLLLVLASVAGGLADGPEDRTGRWSPLAELRGERLYRRACAACHGVTGGGNGPAAAWLEPRPRDFTSGVYKFRSTPSGELPTDEDLVRTTSRGVPQTTMPAWERLLSGGEIRDVVAYIKTFSPRFAESAPSTSIAITPEPQVTAETIDEGKQLYVIMQCWSCHGVQGRGDGPAANTLVDDRGARIRAYDFTRGDYKGGSDSRSVYRTFNTGLSGTPMPSYAEVFTFGSEAISDFDAFAAVYSAPEITALRTYLGTQPTAERLDEMSDEALQALVEGRKWSLVHYVSSLSREAGLFYRLFVEDPELTRSDTSGSR